MLYLLKAKKKVFKQESLKKYIVMTVDLSILSIVSKFQMPIYIFQLLCIELR